MASPKPPNRLVVHREIGSVSGRLERISLHGRSQFEIFPVVGPIKVECRFTEKDLLARVKAGLGKFVTVNGTVRFKNWDRLPYGVDANSLEIHKEPKSPVSLSDLRGVAKGMTGGLKAEDYLEKIRGDDGW